MVSKILNTKQVREKSMNLMILALAVISVFVNFKW